MVSKFNDFSAGTNNDHGRGVCLHLYGTIRNDWADWCVLCINNLHITHDLWVHVHSAGWAFRSKQDILLLLVIIISWNVKWWPNLKFECINLRMGMGLVPESVFLLLATFVRTSSGSFFLLSRFRVKKERSSKEL